MLTSEQIAFLSYEMNTTDKSVTDKAACDPAELRDTCASIITEEVTKDEKNDKQFNPDRLAVAEDIFEVLM
jgi:hypothetical protein